MRHPLHCWQFIRRQVKSSIQFFASTVPLNNNKILFLDGKQPAYPTTLVILFPMYAVFVSFYPCLQSLQLQFYIYSLLSCVIRDNRFKLYDHYLLQVQSDRAIIKNIVIITLIFDMFNNVCKIINPIYIKGFIKYSEGQLKLQYYLKKLMQSLACYEKVICKVLRSGVVPHHIGFIMDGNRRHAKKYKFSSTHQGHVQGVKSLKKCLLICKEIGVEQVSLFCFSIQNFNRSKEQVDGLMNLCIETFNQMSTMSQMLLKQQIKVNIIGRKDKLRQDVRQALQKIQDKTRQYSRIIVNLCFAYDSIHQVQTALQKMDTPNYPNFINGLSINRHLDLLIRTANEYRLSNFMLAQAAYAHIHILKQNWPEINILSFIKIILSFNYHYKGIQKNKKMIEEKLDKNSHLQQTQQQIQNQQTQLKKGI